MSRSPTCQDRSETTSASPVRWMIYDECSKKQKDFKEKLRDGAWGPYFSAHAQVLTLPRGAEGNRGAGGPYAKDCRSAAQDARELSSRWRGTRQVFSEMRRGGLFGASGANGRYGERVEPGSAWPSIFTAFAQHSGVASCCNSAGIQHCLASLQGMPNARQCQKLSSSEVICRRRGPVRLAEMCGRLRKRRRRKFFRRASTFTP